MEGKLWLHTCIYTHIEVVCMWGLLLVLVWNGSNFKNFVKTCSMHGHVCICSPIMITVILIYVFYMFWYMWLSLISKRLVTTSCPEVYVFMRYMLCWVWLLDPLCSTIYFHCLATCETYVLHNSRTFMWEYIFWIYIPCCSDVYIVFGAWW